MGKNLDKFLLLMWKNFLTQWRHPVQTAVEILAPLLIASLLVVMRGLVYPEEQAAMLYGPFFTENDTASQIVHMKTRKIAYSPANPIMENIMKELAKELKEKGNFTELELIGRKDSQALEAYLNNEINTKNGTTSYFLAGVQFDDSLNDATKLTPHMDVTLRFPADKGYSSYNLWQTDALFPAFQMPGPRNRYTKFPTSPDYYHNGFLTIQHELSCSIIKYFKQTEGQSFDCRAVPILMQRFPYPKFTEDDLLNFLQYILGLIIMLSYLYTCTSTVKAITLEKEKQLKETMKIMGLPSWLHWTAWFLKSLTMLLITIILMVTMLMIRWYPDSSYAVFTHSNPLVVFLFSFLYVCATITFCFAISVFFSKANIAAVISGMVWLLTFLPFALIQAYYSSRTLGHKLPASLCSNSAMALGFQLILRFEGIEEGVQWHNLWKSVSPDDDLVLGHLMLMLLLDTLLYLMIALYVEAVFPGDYGVPQPWYFPFSPTYWCGNKKSVDYDSSEDVLLTNEYYEREPAELEVGIKIKHLRKQFSTKNVAVKDLSFNLYKDQITVLLGHNGAGKTTTMSMLTGMFPPTSGTAIVEGYDIRTQMPEVRDSLGLCPQHNILFDDLTVREHLYFYSRLKGLNKKEIGTEIDKFIELLELTDKGEAKSSTLSGGMKRKLSVAIALCGGSKVVMCDEPSSGMDPSARRALWNLLQSQKKGRTILLTTHFMDEADLLGDRIAIMAHGKLKCHGSSYFLKKKYGAGYHLIMDKSPQCDIDQVTHLLQKYIPNIQVESDIGSELSYTLNEEYSEIFQTMLGDLERQSSQLGILSYGISLTNFDEVFMKVSTIHDNGQSNLDDNNEDCNRSFDNLNQATETKLNVGTNLLTGCALWTNQFLAMLMKRGLSILRSWFLFLLQIGIPILAVALVIIINRIVSTLDNLPTLKIELDSYGDPVIVLTDEGATKYSAKYIQYLNDNNKELIDWGDSKMIIKMLKESKEKLSEVRIRYLTGASFWKNSTITAWFNNNAYHTSPLALQQVMNAILQRETSSEHYIQIFNHPLPFSTKAQLSDEPDPTNIGFQISLILGFAMAFASAFYIMFYVKERVSNAKHLQFVSGVQVLIFWGTSYLCDLLTFLLGFVFVIITFAIFPEDGFRTADDLGRLFSILFHFGLSVLPLIYLASFCVSVPATGYTKMVFFNLASGIATFIIMNFFEDYLYFLHWLFLFFPLYSLCIGIRDATENYATHRECNELIQNCIDAETTDSCDAYVCKTQVQCCDLKGYYNILQPGIGANVLYAYITTIVLFLILLGIEYHIFERLKYRIFRNRSPAPAVSSVPEDSDVHKEKGIIKNASMVEIRRYELIMKSVSKYYNKFLAVNDLCLGVNRYECFGLLGVNGAGKTTTFKMMTGEIPFSDGDAWVKGLNLKTDMKRVHQMIGYCPQFDALLDDLTCRETLIIFSLLRGYTMSESKAMAQKLSKDFDFYPHLFKQVKQLSGGNKRKLSTALTLIGDPAVLYLDEPTTGMDPATKRYLWRALCKVRDCGKCIILTSHSMEECEALCTRIAIMVNGGFMCLGSTQHLKNKFSEGYTLIIRLRQTNGRYDLEPIQNFVNQNFPNSEIRENHLELVTFYLPDKSKPWSQMFGIMEQGKKTLNIEDYSLGQSSLEQVFLSFTKYQRDK